MQTSLVHKFNCSALIAVKTVIRASANCWTDDSLRTRGFISTVSCQPEKFFVDSRKSRDSSFFFSFYIVARYNATNEHASTIWQTTMTNDTLIGIEIPRLAWIVIIAFCSTLHLAPKIRNLPLRMKLEMLRETFARSNRYHHMRLRQL